MKLQAPQSGGGDAKRGSDFFFEHAAVASDRHVMAGLVRTEHDATVLGRGGSSGGLELTDLDIVGPMGDQSNYLDINLTLDADGSSGVDTHVTPLFVAFRFNLERLFPLSAPVIPLSQRPAHAAATASLIRDVDKPAVDRPKAAHSD